MLHMPLLEHKSEPLNSGTLLPLKLYDSFAGWWCRKRMERQKKQQRAVGRSLETHFPDILKNKWKAWLLVQVFEESFVDYTLPTYKICCEKNWTSTSKFSFVPCENCFCHQKWPLYTPTRGVYKHCIESLLTEEDLLKLIQELKGEEELFPKGVLKATYYRTWCT